MSLNETVKEIHIHKIIELCFDYIWFISITHLAISSSGEKLRLDGCLGIEGRDAVIVFEIGCYGVGEITTVEDEDYLNWTGGSNVHCRSLSTLIS
jgi:hypothetical protein